MAENSGSITRMRDYVWLSTEDGTTPEVAAVAKPVGCLDSVTRLAALDDLVGGAGAGGRHRDVVGEKRGFAQAVGHEHDAVVGAREQHRQILAEDHAGLLVERAERLVHEQDAGFETERARERGALAHAAGELRRIVLR